MTAVLRSLSLRLLRAQVSLAQAVYICPDIRFYELLRSDLLTSGRNSLKVRVFGYHRVKAPAPSKLIAEATGSFMFVFV